MGARDSCTAAAISAGAEPAHDLGDTDAEMDRRLSAEKEALDADAAAAAGVRRDVEVDSVEE